MATESIRAEEFGLEPSRREPAAHSALQQEVSRIFNLLREPVFRQVLRLLGNPAEAEDVTQEVFLRLYIEMRDRGSLANPRGWLFRTAYNLAIDISRADRHVASLDEPGAPEPPDAAQDGDRVQSSLLEREKRDRVSRLLRGLSPQQRRCMELRTEGLRYREIAEALGVRISTVETNLTRAIKKLMEEVGWPERERQVERGQSLLSRPREQHDVLSATAALTPILDAVEEFKVQSQGDGRVGGVLGGLVNVLSSPVGWISD